MELQFLAIQPRSGHQQLHDHVVFAVVTAERLVVNVRDGLEGIVNRGANLAVSFVEGAVRFRSSRDLPDTIVGHQRQRAVNIVPIPGREKFFRQNRRRGLSCQPLAVGSADSPSCRR